MSINDKKIIVEGAYHLQELDEVIHKLHSILSDEESKNSEHGDLVVRDEQLHCTFLDAKISARPRPVKTSKGTWAIEFAFYLYSAREDSKDPVFLMYLADDHLYRTHRLDKPLCNLENRYVRKLILEAVASAYLTSKHFAPLMHES